MGAHGGIIPARERSGNDRITVVGTRLRYTLI